MSVNPLEVDLTNSPSRTAWRLEQRHSFSAHVRFTVGVDDEPVDTTECIVTFYMQNPVHRGGNVFLTKLLVELDPIQGAYQLNLQAIDLDLVPGSYPFEIKLETPEAYVSAVLKGNIEIVSNPDPGFIDDEIGRAHV